jgi:hypothetical protein
MRKEKRSESAVYEWTFLHESEFVGREGLRSTKWGYVRILEYPGREGIRGGEGFVRFDFIHNGRTHSLTARPLKRPTKIGLARMAGRFARDVVEAEA